MAYAQPLCGQSCWATAFHILPLSQSLSHSHTQITHSQSHTHRFTHSSHTFTQSHSHTQILTVPHRFTHSHSHSHSHILSHTESHTLALALTPPHLRAEEQEPLRGWGAAFGSEAAALSGAALVWGVHGLRGAVGLCRGAPPALLCGSQCLSEPWTRRRSCLWPGAAGRSVSKVQLGSAWV